MSDPNRYDPGPKIGQKGPVTIETKGFQRSMPAPRCESCRHLFFQEEEEPFTNLGNRKLARCRRYPPTRDAGGDCEFPQIYDPSKDWCGEWVGGR